MTIDKEEMFEYLDTLRETGVTNMFGAGVYLQQAFGVDRREAKSVLTEWMKTYGQRQV
jgi:hypothetical protein